MVVTKNYYVLWNIYITNIWKEKFLTYIILLDIN